MHTSFQRVVAEERHGEAGQQDHAERGGGQEQQAAPGTGPGAGAAGAHGGAVGQQNVIEQVAEEEPLRHLARGAYRRRGGRLGLGAHAEDAGGA